MKLKCNRSGVISLNEIHHGDFIGRVQALYFVRDEIYEQAKGSSVFIDILSNYLLCFTVMLFPVLLQPAYVRSTAAKPSLRV